MFKIAVTGGIACGKSLAGKFLQDAGLAVLDADDVVHRLMAKGRVAYCGIIREFGEEFLDEDGEIDRDKLGAYVFSEPPALEKLNGLVHPEARKYWEAWLADCGRAHGLDAAVVIIPLLFECGFGVGWDRIICIASLPSVQTARVQGMKITGAEQRIAVQWPSLRKAKLSDYVVINNGSKELVGRQVNMILSEIMEK